MDIEGATVVEDRPVAKCMLPFKPIYLPGSGNRIVKLEWISLVQPIQGTARKVPFQIDLEVGPNHELAQKVLELMRMFWEQEAKVNGLVKERDDAVIALSRAEGEVVTLKASLEGHRRLKVGQKG